MADERRFYAGDLGTQHLDHHVEVEAPDVEVSGTLLAVMHQKVARSTGAVTVVTLARDDESDPWVVSPTFAVDPNFTVVVRTVEEQHRRVMAAEARVDNATDPGERP